MAAPKRKAGRPKKFVGKVAVKKIWSALTPGQWNSVLTSIAPEYNWQLNGTTILAKCPYHPDSNPSFRLLPTRGFGKCFGCGKFVNDIVELLKHLKKVSYTEALMSLVNEHKLQHILGSDTDSFAAYHRLQEMKKEATVAFNQLILEFLRDKPAHLAYLAPAITYLIRGRNINKDVIRGLPVGVFAKPEHVKKLFKDRSYDDLYDEYFKDTSHLWGSPVFNYNDSTGSVSIFKIRKLAPKTVVDPIMGSAESWMDIDPISAKELVTKEFQVLNDPYAEGRGLFGLHYYYRLVGNEKTEAYVTEGEFDALSIMAAQAELGRQDFMMLATGGNANDVSFLTESDIKHVWVVPDHPSAKGTKFAMLLLSNAKNYVARPSSMPLKFKVFQWPSTLTGLDLDEAVQLNGYEVLYGYLFISRNEFFLNASPWVMAQCDMELEGLKTKLHSDMAQLVVGSPTYDVAKSNLEDNHRSLQQETLLKWVGCINDPTEKLSFARKYDEITGIDIAQHSTVHASMYALDTLEGCASALRTAMSEMFAWAYYENKSQGNQITLWSKERHELVPVKQATLDSVVSQYGDCDSMTWALRILKDSPLLAIDEPTMTAIRNRAQNIKFMLDMAYNGMLHHAKPLNSLSKVGQGAHYELLPASAKVAGNLYFVNGTKVFRGKYAKDTKELDWEFINNVVDGDLVFKLNVQDKWSYVNDVADLYNASQVDLHKLFKQLLTLIDGWKFENHEYMREYIAAWILSIPVQRAYGKINITFVTGESNSGKTSFARGLLGGIIGHSHEVPSVLESAVFRSDASAASMYQDMDGSALLFTIDEAESSDAHNTDHDNRTREIQRMCFSIPYGGHTTARGGATADQKQSYHLQLPVLMCGININNDPVFLSRVVTIYTQKELQRENIGDYIDRCFPNREDLTLIRRQVTIGLLPHLNELQAVHSELQKTLPKVQTSVTVPGRFIECILPALTVYKFLGFDAEDLFKKITAGNKQRLEAVYHATGRMDLIHTVLYTKSIRTTSDDSPMALQDPRTLIMNEEFNLLNNSNIGVYYYADKNWVVIVWRQAKYSVLRNTQYFSMDEASLREKCSKSMHVINVVSEKEHKDLTHSLQLRDIRHKSAYTVLDASYIIDSEEVAAFVGTPSQVATPTTHAAVPTTHAQQIDSEVNDIITI